MAYQRNSYTTLEVGNLPKGVRVPTRITYTTVGTHAVGATAINLTASPTYIQAGRDLVIGGNIVTVANSVPRTTAAVTLNLLRPLTVALASAATFLVVEQFAFLGGEEMNVTHAENVIQLRSYRSANWQDQVKVMCGITIDTAGQFLTDDLAITNVIRPSSIDIEAELWCETKRQNGDRYAGVWLATGFKEPAPLDNVLRAEFSLQSVGAIALPAPLSLAVVAI